MESEVPPVQPIRLKVEINCMEHFNVLGLDKVPFEVDNSWFNGKCELTTYKLDELVGTKLRALYQRKKGRDLLDLQLAIQSGKLDVERVLECYNRYMEFVMEKAPTYKQFVQNMEMKLQDPEFLCDTGILLREDATHFDPQPAWELVKRTFVDRMPGKRE
jgi:predicted nucleotidyltransferase component of viral defense system